MKRCSQCEFTFEDRQQFCDFDGTELTGVPEPAPSFKNVKVPRGASASLLLRVVRSRVSLTVLALAGLMLSALVIGYYDSGSQSSIDPDFDLVSNAESRNEVVNPVPQGALATSVQAKPAQASQPRFISTERRISAREKASSMPASTTIRPSTASRKRARAISSTSKPEGKKPRFERGNKELLARKQQTGAQRVNRESVTGNSKRPDGRESENSRQQKDPKVVAILKKTGNILARPFRF